MWNHPKEEATSNITRRDAAIGAALTLGTALVVAAVMIIGDGPLFETIGLVMFPGVLVVGAQWIHVRGRSRLTQVALIGGPLVVLLLIGIAAGLAMSH